MGEVTEYCLKRRDMTGSMMLMVAEMRKQQELCDVTLVCSDGQVKAHKVILSACSHFFRKIFNTNPHPHPLLYLSGLNLQELIKILNYIYLGEVNIHKRQLENFLNISKNLQLIGLDHSESGLSHNSGKRLQVRSKKEGDLKVSRPLVNQNKTTFSSTNKDDPEKNDVDDFQDDGGGDAAASGNMSYQPHLDPMDAVGPSAASSLAAISTNDLGSTSAAASNNQVEIMVADVDPEDFDVLPPKSEPLDITSEDIEVASTPMHHLGDPGLVDDDEVGLSRGHWPMQAKLIDFEESGSMARLSGATDSMGWDSHPGDLSGRAHHHFQSSPSIMNGKRARNFRDDEIDYLKFIIQNVDGGRLLPIIRSSSSAHKSKRDKEAAWNKVKRLMVKRFPETAIYTTNQFKQKYRNLRQDKRIPTIPS